MKKGKRGKNLKTKDGIVQSPYFNLAFYIAFKENRAPQANPPRYLTQIYHQKAATRSYTTEKEGT